MVSDQVIRHPWVNSFDPKEVVEGLPCAERYLFAAGMLTPNRISDQPADEVSGLVQANMTAPMMLCEAALQHPRSRVCVIGSMSGIDGSYNDTYAAAKAGLHHYVQHRRLGPQQQLVCVAPAIIEDAGMTWRRHDLDLVHARVRSEPKGRLLRAEEIADVVRYLLYDASVMLTNCVLPVDGGRRC